MEMEAGTATVHHREARIFPLDILGCCPARVTALLPRHWLRIHGCTHLALTCGTFSCGMLIVVAVRNIYDGSCLARCVCTLDLLAIASILPCMVYFCRTVGFYSDRLQVTQQAAREQKQRLLKSWSDLVSDMEGLLTQSAESSAGLAERSFESKRRDFQRFLERARSRQPTFQPIDAQLLKQFRRFVLNWLKVFEECSIDPLNYPKHVVSAEALTRCVSIEEVCDVCLDRLRVTEVCFISLQRDLDTQLVRKSWSEFNRHNGAGRAPSRRIGAHARSLREELMDGNLPVGPHGGEDRVSWLQVGLRSGFRCASSMGSSQGFPWELRFGCGRIVFLSRDHSALLAGFCAGWVLLCASLFIPGPTSVAPLAAVAEVCIAVLLLRFDEIDAIQRLEREVKALASLAKTVGQQNEKMHHFWSTAQELTELWLYRTVPRLEVYKEIQGLMEDAAPEDLLSQLSSFNDHLESLEKCLGSLESWRNGGQVPVTAKKRFGQMMNLLCQEEDFGEMMVKLEEFMATDMHALKATTCTYFSMVDDEDPCASSPLA